MKKLLGIVVLSIVLTLGNSAKADCGRVTIAEMNWASAELIANLDKIILEEGFGCRVQLVPGSTMDTFNSMKNGGEPDIAPEVWSNSIYRELERAVGKGRLHVPNSEPIAEIGEGWWITPNTAKKYPQLKTVLDVIENPQLFGGRFVGCPSGWGCSYANKNMFNAFNMKQKGWKLIKPSSAADLDRMITKAANSNQNWFGYYWAPTSMVGKYNLVKLRWGVSWAGESNWNNCMTQKKCKNPKRTSWSTATVNTVVSDNFKYNAGTEAMNYLRERTFPLEVMNNMLVYMAETQSSGRQAAVEFLKRYKDVWIRWMPQRVAKNVGNSVGVTVIVKKNDEKPKKKKPKKKEPKATPNDEKIVAAAMGSGFFVSKTGHIITNHHVIDQCKVVKVKFKGDDLKAKVLAVDKTNDLAIIKSNAVPDKVLSVSNKDVSLLQDIIVAGYPLGKKVSSSIKIHKGSVTSLAGFGDNYSNFQTDATINQGNSGGPVMDKNGNVVGVAVALMPADAGQNIFFAVKSSTLKTFASANNLSFLEPNNRPMSNKDLGNLITSSTVYLDCFMTIAKIKQLIAQENRKAFYKEYQQ